MISHGNETTSSETQNLRWAFDWFDKMSMYMDHLMDIQKQIEITVLDRIESSANEKLTPIVASSCVLMILCIVYPLLIRAMWRITCNIQEYAVNLEEKNNELKQVSHVMK